MPRGRKEEVKKPVKRKRVSRSRKKPAQAENRENAFLNDDQPEYDFTSEVESLESEQRYAQLAKIERDKRLVMWTGVSFFMLVIIFVWIFNIKAIVNSTPKNSSSDLSWKEISDNFSNSIEQAKKSMEEVKSTAQALSTATSTVANGTGENSAPSSAMIAGRGVLGDSGLATSTNASVASSTEQVNMEELKQKINELERKLQSGD